MCMCVCFSLSLLKLPKSTFIPFTCGQEGWNKGDVIAVGPSLASSSEVMIISLEGFSCLSCRPDDRMMGYLLHLPSPFLPYLFIRVSGVLFKFRPVEERERQKHTSDLYAISASSIRYPGRS